MLSPSATAAPRSTHITPVANVVGAPGVPGVPGAEDRRKLAAAARLIEAADVLLVCAGPNMAARSSLPEFCGDQSLWKAFPPFAKRGWSLAALASRSLFGADPYAAWGFWSHARRVLEAAPLHPGFAALKRWSDRLEERCQPSSGPAGGAWIVTSNVGEAFARAGFSRERTVECGGSLGWRQCTRCHAPPWPATSSGPDGTGKSTGASISGSASWPALDAASGRACQPLPLCADCHGLARPNVRLQGDGDWNPERALAQESGFWRWVFEQDEALLVVIECGTNCESPTGRSSNGDVRRLSDGLVEWGAHRIRIDVPVGAPVSTCGDDICLAGDACETLAAIDALIPR